jgi:adenylylsulfate reductase subunit B
MPPVIDYEKCIGCGKCVDVCSEDVFFGTKGHGRVQGEKPVVSYPDECCHYNACGLVCPVEGAIKLRIPLPMRLLYK